ncbi:ribonuclease HII [Occultella glacieicola]|uniref:Ribonuclease n=2 Tax=Occultella glacieicola TaxID=2518684 RepID=A0ABY2DXK4_9MICO|nr:ribonuclease HII [Occultella glacieicola]
MDEVGRGALAGPVSVGVVVVDADTGRSPAGLRDSKLLRPALREGLCAPIRRWSVASAVGHADPVEIDRIGIIAALRLAGTRALAAIAGDGIEVDVVILDGNHDWLTAPADLFTPAAPTPPVTTRIKADLTCSVVAAASVLAKCERDAMMRELHLEFPTYAWHDNKGYSAPEHLAALGSCGPSVLHRRSWSLPGVGTEGTAGAVTMDAEAPVAAGGGMMDQ